MSGGEPVVIRRNDWGPLTDALPQVQPRLTVSVVIPARDGQDRLDLVLAALAAQTYPGGLTEVVVVDDGSTPALRLPELRPPNCTIVRAPETGWGRAHACHTGALAASGDVVHWLDADIVTFPEHIEEQLRWHHVADYLVTIGYKRLVGEWSLTPERVYRMATDGRMEELFAVQQTQPHAWVERLIQDAAGLRTADAEAFRAAVGSTSAVHRELYLHSGGMDTCLRLGEDSELAYRLAQRGAVFVPVPAARSWHLGIPTATHSPEMVRRYNRPYLANRMPLPRFRRWQARRSWRVPYVEIVVDASTAGYESVATTVDSVLASTLTDCAVLVVGPWSTLDDARTVPLDDGVLGDLRLVREHVAGDARVQLIEQVAASSFPVTFRLELDPGRVLSHDTLERMVAAANGDRAGVVEVTPPCAVRLWRTAAVERARRVLPDLDLAEAVSRVWGRTTVDARTIGLWDAAALDAGGLRTLLKRVDVGPGRSTTVARWSQAPRRGHRISPAAVRRRAIMLLHLMTGRRHTRAD